MCGIVGVASNRKLPDRGWLSTACKVLHHRGPDDSGQWWSDSGMVGLAQTRLATIDLSPAGRQPMHATNYGLIIVFNGEIYNFQDLRAELEALGYDFRSHSDTEVILAAYAQWGTECVSRFIGMFAFVIYDTRNNRLFFARDRVGEKPLFYRIIDGTIQFASELKALLADPHLPRAIAPEALESYLFLGYVPDGACILSGYRKLPPAHTMEYDIQSGKAQLRRYWNIPEYRPVENDDTGLLHQLDSLLADSVRRQMITDVPLGVLLSGGLDSSLIAAMAVRNSDRVQTFTIGFEGGGALNEIEHGRRIAEYFGTEHTELLAKPNMAELLPQLAVQFDEPIVDTSMFPTFIVSQLVRQHCTVALSGDGGDELFGGYQHYKLLLRQRNLFGWVPRPVRSVVSDLADMLMPVGVGGRNLLKSLDTDFSNGLPANTNFFSLDMRRRLIGATRHRAIPDQVFAARVPQQADLLQRATRMDFRDYLANDVLVKVDRASMANSLEVRAPWLDYRLIEFAFAKVPSRLKATADSTKILSKRLAARYLPPEFNVQHKQGFSIPLADWLKVGPFRDMFWSILTDPACMFDRRAVQSLLDGQDAGRSNGDRLFALVLFELWRKEYGAH